MTDAVDAVLARHRAEERAAARPQLVVYVPGRPPTPNSTGGRNSWAAGARERAEWKDTARKLAVDAVNRARWPEAQRVRLTITFVVPTHGRRDWDNLVAGTKPLTDGLVAAHVMSDDSLEVVAELVLRWRYERGIAGTEYTVERLEVPQEGLGLVASPFSEGL